MYIVILCYYMPFFDPEVRLVIHRGKLPHWRQAGVIYFVTFRLADSLPQAKLEWLRREKELWIQLNPKPHNSRQQDEYHRRFTESIRNNPKGQALSK
jgi:type I restriction enzyme, R subunit